VEAIHAIFMHCLHNQEKKTHTARENALVPARASRTGEIVKAMFEVRLYNCISMLLSIAACTLPLVEFPN
jgi:hypothetical protein